jgi:predicted esterase
MLLKEKIIQNIKYILPLAIFIILLVILYPFVNSFQGVEYETGEKDNRQSVKSNGASYELYLPENYSSDNQYNLFVCLSPSGNGSQFYEIYSAFSDNGLIMACSNDFKNNIAMDKFLPKVNNLITDVKNKHKINKIYIGGLSGGGMGSYIVSYFNPIIDGLIINSGAIHQNLNNQSEIKKMKARKIVLICGKNDNVVPCDYMEKDRKFLESAGFKTFLIEFDGGHKLAPAGLYDSAIKWLELN